MSKVYELITNKILEKLEKGVIPWQMPWNTQMPKNLITKKPYRGINILLLSFTDYKSPYWLTYKQARDLKGFVKTGAKGTPIVYWNIARVLPIDTEDEAERLIPLLKYHTVFNVEQCEKIPVPKDDLIEFKPIEECERVINNMPKKPVIQEGKNRACYIPVKDVVEMPDRTVFKSVEEYYSTLFHELVHSTGHISRLNRNTVSELSPFGSENYSKEELIAEIGASFICGMTGITNQTFENNSSYISNWLQRLRNDKKLIITASSHAQRACDFILNRIQNGVDV
jgi:antirestriction protein ArdC